MTWRFSVRLRAHRSLFRRSDQMILHLALASLATNLSGGGMSSGSSGPDCGRASAAVDGVAVARAFAAPFALFSLEQRARRTVTATRQGGVSIVKYMRRRLVRACRCKSL